MSSQPVVDDTVPARAAFALTDDPTFHDLVALTDDARAKLTGQGWDNLAHVAAFARALGFAHEQLLDRYPDALDRRRIAAHLFPLLPVHARARAWAPLPEEICARAADGFVVGGADLPRFPAALSAHLADGALLERALVPGSVWLAPRGVCPAAAVGAALLLRIHAVTTASAALRATAVSAPPTSAPLIGGSARCTALSAHEDGVTFDVRTAADGKPILVDGKTQPIDVPLDTLAAWLLGAGPDARGLDLRATDDRALLLVFAHLLRERGLLQPLAHADGFDAALVDACVETALDAVAAHVIDPIASRIALRSHANDLGWPQRAHELLAGTQATRDVTARHADPTLRASTPPAFARDVVWADAVLAPGFVAGRMSSTAQGRAFARLCTSLLAPLGVLPCAGMKDGSGDVLLHVIDPDGSVQRKVASFAGVPRVRALADAWRDGSARALPDPRGAPQHDLQAMPAWVAFFFEALASEPAPTLDDPETGDAGDDGATA